MQKFFLVLWMMALIIADQVSKWWIIEVFYKPRVFEAEGGTLSFFEWFTTFGQTQFPPVQIEVTSFFNLVMVWNKGVSFGMFASASDIMPYILSAVAVIMSVILGIWMKRATHLSTIIPLALVIAGALANVFDRFRFGAVADFLDFHINDWHYPAFNIADCCIVVGVLLLAFDGIILDRRRAKLSAPKEEASNEAVS